jgi:aryl-alcohol dehydrogenase-like predicted oxidoreductase
MEYRYFGNTGLKVSKIALGTQTFGWGADEKTAFALADLYVENGGNFFDTANIYNDGVSETMLGAWLKARGMRRNRIIASKVFFPTGEGPNDAGLSRKHILQSIEESLSRLNTDYIDLYQMHCWDSSTPLEETLSTLNDLVRMGKVRYLGASNYSPSQLEKALMTAKLHGWDTFVSLQAEYSLIVRSTEWELLPLCVEEGIGFLAWSPLAGGWLTGKYRRGQAHPRDSRGRGDRWDDLPEQRESDLTWRVVDTLVSIGKERGVSPSQVALNWLLQKKGVTAPIVGARTVDQLRQNIGCTLWSLSAEEKKRLDSASEIPLPYPYRFIERYTRKR